MITSNNKIGIKICICYYNHDYPSNNDNIIVIILGNRNTYNCRVLFTKGFGIHLYKSYKKNK